MQMPFGRLMELVAQLPDDDPSTLGQLAERWGEPVRRIADAIDAVKVANGEPSYIGATVSSRDGTPHAVAYAPGRLRDGSYGQRAFCGPCSTRAGDYVEDCAIGPVLAVLNAGWSTIVVPGGDR